MTMDQITTELCHPLFLERIEKQKTEVINSTSGSSGGERGEVVKVAVRELVERYERQVQLQGEQQEEAEQPVVTEGSREER
jgi:hypothetical protein